MRLHPFDAARALLAATSVIIGALYLAVAFLRLRATERRLEPRELDGEAIRVSRDLGPALLGVIAPRIVLPSRSRRITTSS